MAQRPSAGDVISRAGRPVLCAGCGAEQEVVPKGYLVLGPIPGQGRVGPKPVEVQRSGTPDPSHQGGPRRLGDRDTKETMTPR